MTSTREAPPAYDAAAPSYPSAHAQQPPPAYPELEQHPASQEKESVAAAPPYSPVQHAAEPVVVYQVYSPPQGGETYEANTNTVAVNNAGRSGGEAANDGRVVYANANGYPANAGRLPYGQVPRVQPRSSDPRELFHCKIRDHRINIFRPGNTTTGCVCCCHLQMAAYVSLILFAIYNALRVEGMITTGYWIYYHEDLAAYDTFLAVVFALHIPINILCFVGVWHCRANYIRPQVFAVASYAVLSVLSIIVDSIYGYGVVLFYLWIIVGIVCIVWWTWVFQRVYRWAYYYEQGGIYNHDMMKPPPKSEMHMYRRQQAQVQAQNDGGNQVEMQPVPR